MTRLTSALSQRAPWRLLAAAAPLLAVGSALAEADPYTIGASETVTHDSNIARQAGGSPLPAGLRAPADWIFSTALFGNIDQPIGRQRVYVNASVRNNHFRYNNLYSNVSYGVNGGLDWSTVERISGNLALSSNRNLASFNRNIGNNTPEITKNIETTDQLSAVARIGVVTDLTVDGGYTHQNQRFSAVGARLSQNVYRMGLRYRLGGELTYGAGLRFTDGEYVERNDSVRGRNLDLTAEWVPSPISTVNARLSLGRSTHSLDTEQDFSGATGELRWNWQPTAKMSVGTQISRSTGNESSFLARTIGTEVVTAQGDNSRLTTALGLNVGYEATAKIRLDTSYALTSRKLTNSTALNSSVPRSQTDGDRLTSLSLGARYVPTRTVALSCSIARESRKADNSTLTHAYGATVGSCAAQISVQP